MSSSMGDIPRLADDQLESFDTEYVSDDLWKPIRRCIDRDFPDGRFTFLDAGGGVGVFADRVLANYPDATGVVLDNSQMLLDRNVPDPRKTVMMESVENIATAVDQRYDIVFANWVLHHLVSPSYRQTQQNIDAALRSMSGLLTDRGRLSVYENLYDGMGIDAAPSRIIHALTCTKSLARLLRRFGANTAGVGVCFLSSNRWLTVFARGGFTVVDRWLGPPWGVSRTRRAALLIKDVRCGHYWLTP